MISVIIYKSIVYLFNITFFILIISCFLTWLPNIEWYKQPYRFLYEFSNFIFSPFRKIIPPIGGLDFSPIIAFLALGALEKVILIIIGNVFF